MWKRPITLDELNAFHVGTLSEATGMTFVDIGDSSLTMRMPVDACTQQPMGLLHGGATAALAETIGSVASFLSIDPAREMAVGIELNCSHLRGVRAGYVEAVCTPVRVGRSLHVWDIRVSDDRQRPVCICRLTVSIIAQRSSPTAKA